jgi:acyl carrier protein
MTIEDKLRTFLTEELGVEHDRSLLTDDYGLLENEVVDSLGIFQIVSFLESEFGIEVLDEELVPDNFSTIASMARLVDEKQGG